MVRPVARCCHSKEWLVGEPDGVWSDGYARADPIRPFDSFLAKRESEGVVNRSDRHCANSGFPFAAFNWQRPRERNGALPNGAAPQACFVTLSRPAQAGREPQRSVSGSALKCATRPSVDVQSVPRLIAASSHTNAWIPFIKEENRMKKTKYRT